jgi:hypothetical protein
MTFNFWLPGSEETNSTVGGDDGSKCPPTSSIRSAHAIAALAAARRSILVSLFKSMNNTKGVFDKIISKTTYWRKPESKGNVES